MPDVRPPHAPRALSHARTRVANAFGVAATLSLFAIPAVLFAPGCQGHQCESDGFKDYGYGPGEGELLTDGNTWETTPNDDSAQRWIPFTPYHTWILHPQGLEGRAITSVITYISADPDPNSAGKNFSIAAGNQALISVSEDSRNVFITNSTCAPFYIRVVITTLPPAVQDGGGIDGGDLLLDAGQDADLDAGDGGD